MAEADFFSDAAHRRVRDLVVSVEAQTAAELVVSIRRHASDAALAAERAAALSCFLLLLGFLFLPQSFGSLSFPIELALAFFALRTIFVRWPGLIRRFTGRARIERETLAAAEHAFLELGVSGTRARSGFLVLFAVEDRSAALVLDRGVASALAQAETQDREAFRAIERALHEAARRADLEAVLTALSGTGPLLGRWLPPQADDENELPDEMVVG